jgi:hypothetical protein
MVNDILTAIDSELIVLKQARALLAGNINGTKLGHKKGTMSAAGRARVAAAQRKRWAKLKRRAK